MLEQGLIEESDDRPDPHLDDERRRYYRLTAFGRQVARAEAARMQGLVRLARRSSASRAHLRKTHARFTEGTGSLLRLYPAGFRETHGFPSSGSSRTSIGRGRHIRSPRFWRRTLVDLAIAAATQIAGEVRQDTRHVVRTWRASTVAFAIATLAIAIGANTGVFSVLNALLLRSLPFEPPERLASLRRGGPGFNGAKFHAWRQQTAYLEDAACYDTMNVNADDGVHAPAHLRLTETSWNFFRLLGSPPVLGRYSSKG
jgi:hypothetical protein